MGTLDFEILATTDMRDSKGFVMQLVTLVGITGTYEKGGIVVTPEEFDLKSIEYIGMNNFFAYPVTDNAFDVDGDWTKAVDIQPTKVIVDGEAEWRLVVFLYAIDGAEVPDGTPMVFTPEVPISMIVLGSKRPPR